MFTTLVVMHVLFMYHAQTCYPIALILWWLWGQNWSALREFILLYNICTYISRVQINYWKDWPRESMPCGSIKYGCTFQKLLTQVQTGSIMQEDPSQGFEHLFWCTSVIACSCIWISLNKQLITYLNKWFFYIK